MPGMSGLDVLKRVRDRGIQTPTLFLTAHDALSDKVAGFEAGVRNRQAGTSLRLLNTGSWVYEEVFRAPLSDPWMGLAPEEVYVALPVATRTAASSKTGPWATGSSR